MDIKESVCDGSHCLEVVVTYPHLDAHGPIYVEAVQITARQ
jgi:hypothetical protein